MSKGVLKNKRHIDSTKFTLRIQGLLAQVLEAIEEILRVRFPVLSDLAEVG
jgi:hypothetical protein